MYNKNNVDIENRITVGINELQSLLSVGKNTAIKIGEDAKAVIRIGKRKLYNVDKIKKYMEDKNNEQNEKEPE